jgi:hypothetical protein
MLLSMVSAAFAQRRTSAISGTVSDQSGAVVSGVAVTATHIDTGKARSARTGDDGLYRLPLLEVGEYEVVAALEGFQTSRHEDVNLALDREAVVNPCVPT